MSKLFPALNNRGTSLDEENGSASAVKNLEKTMSAIYELANIERFKTENNI